MTFLMKMKFVSHLLIGLAAWLWMGGSRAHASWDRNEWMLQLDQAIENSSERERVKMALDGCFSATGTPDPGAKPEALKTLYAMESSVAKTTAIFATGWPVDELEREHGSFTPTIRDLPFFLKCFIAYGVTDNDRDLTDHWCVWKFLNLEKIADKWNTVLKTTGRIDPKPISYSTNAAMNLDAYSAQNLRIWTRERLRTALASGHWTEEEAGILRQMEKKLRNDIAKADFPRRVKWLRWTLLGITGVALFWWVTSRSCKDARATSLATS